MPLTGDDNALTQVDIHGQPDHQSEPPKIPWHEQRHLPWYKIVIGVIGFVLGFIVRSSAALSKGGYLFAKSRAEWSDPNLPLYKRLLRATIPIFGPLVPALVLVAFGLLFVLLLALLSSL